jgi:hypothetical protein
MADDPPSAQRPPPQRLPRAGQIPYAPVDIQLTPHPSNDVQPTRQLSEPIIRPSDHRLPHQSEEGVSRLVIAVISIGAVLGALQHVPVIVVHNQHA